MNTQSITNQIQPLIMENSFTELFSILKKYELAPNNNPTLAYSTKELNVLNFHIDNITSILFHGIQNIAGLMRIFSSKININDYDQLCFFLASITNLTEALTDLRLDAHHVLKEN